MLATRMLRLFTTMSYPEIATALARPCHSTAITADQRLSEILRLPAGDKTRFIVWDGAHRDLATVVDELIAVLGSDAQGKPSTVKESIMAVCADRQPRTTREIAIDVLLKRKEELTFDNIVRVRQTAVRMAGAGNFEKCGSRPAHDDSLVWCYVLTESKA